MGYDGGDDTKYDDGTYTGDSAGSDTSGFVLPDEIREPDWSTDTTGGSASTDDTGFTPPDEIREPDWNS